MKSMIKKIGSNLIYRTGLFKLVSFNTKILAFHTVNPKYFEQQIVHLVRNYDVIPLNKIFSKNKNAVVLTFDDGYKNNLKFAYPILQKYNLPATLFITYDFIDKNVFTWWDRLEYSGKKVNVKKLKSLHPNEIEKEVFNITSLNKNSKKSSQYDFMNWNDIKKISDVFEIGSHTLTHPILPTISLKEAQKEIFESKKEIEKRIGKKISSFAYPNGNYNRDLIKSVKKAGYNYAVIYEKGNNTIRDRLNLHRIGINVRDDTVIFAIKVATIQI